MRIKYTGRVTDLMNKGHVRNMYGRDGRGRRGMNLMCREKEMIKSKNGICWEEKDHGKYLVM